MIRKEHWAPTATGGAFYLADPKANEVNIIDIAEGLSKLARFNGQTQQFYSVAQHSCLVMDMLPPNIKAYGLLHDAHEAYIGDITRPVSELLKERHGYNVFSSLKKSIDSAIHEAFGLRFPVPAHIQELVHEMDIVALATEKRDLLTGHDWDWSPVPGGQKLPPPARTVIKPWNHNKAKEKFIQAFENLCVLNPNMHRALQKNNQEFSNGL